MSKYIKGDYTAVVEHSSKTCAINLYIQNTKLGCGLIIPRSTKVGTEYHTTTHSNLFGATTETDKRGIYDEQKIFDELTELGKNIVDFMALCDCQKNIKGAGYREPFIDEAKLCKIVELQKPKLMDYNPTKQYLNRLEAIDNANPSEALECLQIIEADLIGLPKHLTEYDDIFDDYLDDIEDNLDTITQALIKAEKEHNSVNLLMQELDCKDFADLRKYARCGYEKLKSKEIS